MKLTNYLRTAFVSAVMQDVPVQDFDEQIDKARVEAVAKELLENKLHAVVAGCNTRKQLVEALPEFEKYAPKETEKLAGLPAVSGVVADLVAAGWPKGGK